MLKIMISAVGERDPYAVDSSGNRTEGAVLGAIRELNPDIVFLLFTIEQPEEKTNSTQSNSHMTKEEISRLYPQIKVYERPLHLPDPTDYEKIVLLFKREILFIKERYSQSEVEYLIVLSSGTPQMQASFLVLINSNIIKAKIYQVIAPKYLNEGDSRTRSVQTHFLEEENQINRARKYFHSYNFMAASNELVELGTTTIFPERQQKAEVFYELIEGYHYWDLYQHEEALGKIRKANESIGRYKIKELSDLIAEQIKVLERIIDLGENEDYLNLLDLLHNAKRRYKCGQAADCISRFKRLYEGVYYYLAVRDLGISPRKELERQPEWVKTILNTSGRSGLNTYSLSELYYKKLGRRIVSERLENDLNSYSRLRNHSIIAHGMKSITKNDAGQALRLLEKLFKEAFKGSDINNYVLSEQQLHVIEKLIFDSL